MVWMNPPSGQFLKTQSYRDPKQGSLDDCILIAGLSSCAWCSAAFPPNAAPDASGYYSITFYPNRVAKVVKVSQKLCYESSALPFASSSEAGELWPAYYEKAYAAFLTASRTSVSKDEFSMRSVAFGRNGKQVMEDLTNNVYNDPELSTIADAYTFINGRCTGGKTNKPMIAWTLSTGVAAGLKADHAYSVLGVTDTSYIVLRDPRRGVAEPTANVLTGRTVLSSINLNDTTDGIFALNKNTFKSSFVKLAFSA
jgi:hypothetical protein